MRRPGGLFAAVAFVTSLFAGGARAEDDIKGEGPNFLFGASTSYIFDFNDPDTPGLNRLSYANLEQDESFNIDLVQLGVAGKRGNAGYGATIDYGDLALAAGDSADGDVALQTAWLSYTFAETVTATAGRFGTPIGTKSSSRGATRTSPALGLGRRNRSITMASSCKPMRGGCR